MRGSIIRRGKSYSVVLDLGRDPETGKRRQKWHSGYRTKREAEVALADLVGSVNRGTYVAPSKQSFAEFAADWLEAIKPTLRDSTHYSYTRNLRLFLARFPWVRVLSPWNEINHYSQPTSRDPRRAAAFRIFHTVDAAIGWPRPTSSPWMRR